MQRLRSKQILITFHKKMIGKSCWDRMSTGERIRDEVGDNGQDPDSPSLAHPRQGYSYYSSCNGKTFEDFEVWGREVEY